MNTDMEVCMKLFRKTMEVGGQEMKVDRRSLLAADVISEERAGKIQRRKNIDKSIEVDNYCNNTTRLWEEISEGVVEALQ